MWNLILGPVLGLVKTVAGGFMDSAKAKRELKAAKQATELRIELSRATADIDWDKQAMINAGNSWKDEYLLLLFSPPLIMAFIPGLAVYVGPGFEQLALMPDWYKASIGIMVAGSYGHKKLMRYFEGKKSG